MSRRKINVLYALINIFLWGAYGVLVAYASRYFLHLGRQTHSPASCWGWAPARPF